MMIIRNAAMIQAEKLDNLATFGSLHIQSLSCCGECWDCDHCIGSSTH